MMKDRVWEPAGLDEVEGVAGVGTKFLRDTFAANPHYKSYRREVQGLLRGPYCRAERRIRHRRPARQEPPAPGVGPRRQRPNVRPHLRIP